MSYHHISSAWWVCHADVLVTKLENKRLEKLIEKRQNEIETESPDSLAGRTLSCGQEIADSKL